MQCVNLDNNYYRPIPRKIRRDLHELRLNRKTVRSVGHQGTHAQPGDTCSTRGHMLKTLVKLQDYCSVTIENLEDMQCNLVCLLYSKEFKFLVGI